MVSSNSATDAALPPLHRPHRLDPVAELSLLRQALDPDSNQLVGLAGGVDVGDDFVAYASYDFREWTPIVGGAALADDAGREALGELDVVDLGPVGIDLVVGESDLGEGGAAELDDEAGGGTENALGLGVVQELHETEDDVGGAGEDDHLESFVQGPRDGSLEDGNDFAEQMALLLATSRVVGAGGALDLFEEGETLNK